MLRIFFSPEVPDIAVLILPVGISFQRLSLVTVRLLLVSPSFFTASSGSESKISESFSEIWSSKEKGFSVALSDS